MYFIIGGSIGAGIALLFAPKRGSELRADIADVAAKRYDETLEAARDLKRRTADYYEAAKETGNEVLDVVVEGAAMVKQEVAKDVEKIGAIVEDSAKRVVRSSSQTA
jgi:gas vesicle protein